jgi:hypothetical protein
VETTPRPWRSRPWLSSEHISESRHIFQFLFLVLSCSFVLLFCYLIILTLSSNPSGWRFCWLQRWRPWVYTHLASIWASL